MIRRGSPAESPTRAGAGEAVSCESYVHHLSGVHAVVRVERAFERAHHVERRSVLDLEVFHLAEADAVLAAARTAHRQCAPDHAIVQPSRLLELRIIERV